MRASRPAFVKLGGGRLGLARENRLDDLLLPWKIDLLVRDEIDNSGLLEHIARVGRALLAPRDS
jgi:hypothetical protein